MCFSLAFSLDAAISSLRSGVDVADGLDAVPYSHQGNLPCQGLVGSVLQVATVFASM